MTLLDSVSSNGKTPKIIKNRLQGIKSFIIPKKKRNFSKVFPYSRLEFINGTEDERERLRAIARSIFFEHANYLREMLENPKSGSLQEMKESFYCMQESSKIIWQRLSEYDPIVSLIYTLRNPEFMQERDIDFFKSFPEWVQKLIMVFVNTEIKFSQV